MTMIRRRVHQRKFDSLAFSTNWNLDTDLRALVVLAREIHRAHKLRTKIHLFPVDVRQQLF